jgi:hypothetical protein
MASRSARSSPQIVSRAAAVELSAKFAGNDSSHANGQRLRFPADGFSSTLQIVDLESTASQRRMYVNDRRCISQAYFILAFRRDQEVEVIPFEKHHVGA